MDRGKGNPAGVKESRLGLGSTVPSPFHSIDGSFDSRLIRLKSFIILRQDMATESSRHHDGAENTQLPPYYQRGLITLSSENATFSILSFRCV
jgi:hypothetical protein